MSIRPFRDIERRKTKKIKVGKVEIGGDAPISVQSMTNTLTTDVDGVLTTDPAINNKAKKIDKISYEEMLEMSSLGAKIMQPNAVQASMIDNIPVHVRSTFSEKTGTK